MKFSFASKKEKEQDKKITEQKGAKGLKKIKKSKSFDRQDDSSKHQVVTKLAKSYNVPTLGKINFIMEMTLRQTAEW